MAVASERNELRGGEYGARRGWNGDLTCGRLSWICHSYTQPSAAVNRSELHLGQPERERTKKKKHLRREEARLGHGHVPRADDERWGVACVHGPLDDADLEAVAGGVDACDGGRGTAAVARTGVVGGVGGVDGHRAAVPGEDKVGAAGVFFRQDEFGRHYRDAKGRRRFAMSMASYGAGGGSGGREDARLIMSAMDSR